MMPKTSGDSSWRVSDIIFLPIQDSFTTQAAQAGPRADGSRAREPKVAGLKLRWLDGVKGVSRSDACHTRYSATMPS
jgi:hypothetical protein